MHYRIYNYAGGDDGDTRVRATGEDFDTLEEAEAALKAIPERGDYGIESDKDWTFDARPPDPLRRQWRR